MGIEELEKVGLSFDIINAQQFFLLTKAHFFSGIVTNRKKI
jgi:hypothetical protein